MCHMDNTSNVAAVRNRITAPELGEALRGSGILLLPLVGFLLGFVPLVAGGGEGLLELRGALAQPGEVLLLGHPTGFELLHFLF